MVFWRIFPLMTHSPSENMAIDESIYKLKIQNPSSIPNTIRFYRWRPSSVSIGKNQDINEEVDLEACEANNVGIVRRITGGGAVFHMYEGEITYSIIASLKDLQIKDSKEFYSRVLTALGIGLNRLEIETIQGQIQCPALFTNNKKLSGNAQAFSGDIVLQHGTLLIKYNPELMYTVLKARPDKPRTKMIQSVYAHVTTLEQLGVSTDFELLSKYLKEGFIKEFKIINSNIRNSILTEKEQRQIKFLIETRYESSMWTFNKKETFLVNNSTTS